MVKRIQQTALELLEELCKNVPLGYHVEKDAAARYIHLAELTDVLIEEFGSSKVSLDAASEMDHGFIHFDTDELIFEHGRSHPFYEYIKSSDFLSFSNPGNDQLRITYGVKNLVMPDEQ